MLNLGRSASLKNRNSRVRKTVIKIPSDLKYIKKVSSKVLSSLSAYNLNESALFDIRLCVEEAVINAIVHGNRRDKAKAVRIAYWIKDAMLKIEVGDEGSGFDPKGISDPTVNDNITKGSGRGVFLINRLMDEVEYNEAGNKVRLTKHL